MVGAGGIRSSLYKVRREATKLNELGGVGIVQSPGRDPVSLAV